MLELLFIILMAIGIKELIKEVKKFIRLLKGEIDDDDFDDFIL